MSKRTFSIPTTKQVELEIPDRIYEGADPVLDNIVNMWLDKRTFYYSPELREDMYHDDYDRARRAVEELTRLYDAAILARAMCRTPE